MRGAIQRKRGQVETPIIMIFAVTAGVLILLLVGYFVLRQQGAASSAAQLEALTDIRDSLSSLQGSTGVTQNLTLGEGPYRVRCDLQNPGELMLVAPETGDEVSLRGILFAAPASLDSDLLTVTTRPAGTAFRIGTFVYALPPGSIISVGSDLPSMPVRTSVAGAPNEIVHSFSDGTSITLTVQQDPAALESGTITFGAGSNAKTRPYIDSSMLAAAAVTADADLYTCVLDRYVQLLAFNNALQNARLKELKDDATPQCEALYDPEAFEIIERILGTDIATTANDLLLGRNLPPSDIQEIANAMKRIILLNGKLIRGDRCATVS